MSAVKKFYFLEYFYILLRSVERHQSYEDAFGTFRVLKQKHRLGESKFKKLSQDKPLTEKEEQRYRYTFRQVMSESQEYGFIEAKPGNLLTLTPVGYQLLKKYENEGSLAFNRMVFKNLEDRYQAFRTLVNALYEANRTLAGALVFPHYSPVELRFSKRDLQTAEGVVKYVRSLRDKLETHISRYLRRQVSLEQKSYELLKRLTEADLLPQRLEGRIETRRYNILVKRVRDFWISYLLRDLYKFTLPLSTFELWVYRGKQIGVIYVTETYPRLNGKLVFPTSVVLDDTKSTDFYSIYEYSDGKKLYVHEPRLEDFEDEFVDAVVRGYMELRRIRRAYFVNLASLRELVCFYLKISAHTFELHLNHIYRLNLAGGLRIRISLEVDKLPEETNAVYVKQEPVMVDGSYRNIIAIDIAKGEYQREQVDEASQGYA